MKRSNVVIRMGLIIAVGCLKEDGTWDLWRKTD